MRLDAADAAVAGLAAAVCSGIPSTAWALLRREDVLAGGRAAGTMLLPDARGTPLLLAAAAPVHLGISLGWAAVLTAVLPRRAEPAWGLGAGIAIAALDLELIARRRFPAIRALPRGPQWADHAAFGLTVGIVLRVRRRRRARPVGG
jgi:hypothetical protein